MRMVITRRVSITGCAITAKQNGIYPLLSCASYPGLSVWIMFRVSRQNIIPKKCEPASPMNILFFVPNTLYIKNGINAPIVAIEIRMFVLLFCTRPYMQKSIPAAIPYPDDSPSMPSIRLIAFISPTHANIVNGTDR